MASVTESVTLTVHEGGATSLPPTNLTTELGGILTALQGEVDELDTLIQICDQLLDKLQPHQPGKIRITWWKRNRQNELVPTFVKVNDGMGGRWYLSAVPTRDIHKHVKSAGPFRSNNDLVSAIITHAKDLTRRRGKILGLARQHMHAIKNTIPYQERARSTCFIELQSIYAESTKRDSGN